MVSSSAKDVIFGLRHYIELQEDRDESRSKSGPYEYKYKEFAKRCYICVDH